MKNPISTDKAPAAIGPYSQACKIGGMVYVSGQLPIDPVTGEMPSDVADQTAQSMTNLESILFDCGSAMCDIVKTTIFVKNMDDFAKVNEVYAARMPAPYPARSTVEVARLPKDALVEIEAVAFVRGNV